MVDFPVIRLRPIFYLLLLMSPVGAMAEPLHLSVSVAPLSWLVQQLGGERVQVQTLVRSGQDPHVYEPSPGQLAVLQRAEAYLGLDMPFERAWLPRMQAVNPQLRWVMLLDEPRAADLDPHLWANPQNMLLLSQQVLAVLIELSPDHASYFKAQAQHLVRELKTLDEDLAGRLAALPRKTFLVHHPAWGHLASRYGLTQLAVEQQGKEPGPRALAALAAKVRQLGINTVFVEPQASDHLAHGLADVLRLKIVPLDPLAADYPANMRRVADAIVEAAQ